MMCFLCKQCCVQNFAKEHHWNYSNLLFFYQSTLCLISFSWLLTSFSHLSLNIVQSLVQFQWSIPTFSNKCVLKCGTEKRLRYKTKNVIVTHMRSLFSKNSARTTITFCVPRRHETTGPLATYLVLDRTTRKAPPSTRATTHLVPNDPPASGTLGLKLTSVVTWCGQGYGTEVREHPSLDVTRVKKKTVQTWRGTVATLRGVVTAVYLQCCATNPVPVAVERSAGMEKARGSRNNFNCGGFWRTTSLRNRSNPFLIPPNPNDKQVKLVFLHRVEKNFRRPQAFFNSRWVSTTDLTMTILFLT